MTLTSLSKNRIFLQSTPSNELSVSRVSDYFPYQVRIWESTLVAWADRYKIDPNLLAAVMLVESGGNAEAISPSGACGLFQAMASDTTPQYGSMFAGRPTCQQLFNPSLNVGWATHYLVTLYQRNGNSWREALFRYGPIDRGYSYSDLVLAHWENAK